MTVQRVPTELRSAYGPAIEDELRRWLDGRPRVGVHYDMQAYHMGWRDEHLAPTSRGGGKRFRPMLCLLCTEAAGGNWRDALPVAAAIEFLHNFSLIHDDIEDHDETRHHRSTVWRVWGDAQAINAGDGMLALAGLAALGARVTDHIGVRVARRLQETALALTEGQHLDMSFEQATDVSVEDYLRMIGLKTGALIAFSCEAGGILGGGASDQVRALQRFGEHLGLAFQMHDDIRGIWAPLEQTGKVQAKDIQNRKKTLPVLLALERAEGRDRDTLRDYYEREGDADPTTIVAIIDGLRAREHVEAEFGRYLDAAIADLEGVGLRQPYAQQLADLGAALIER